MIVIAARGIHPTHRLTPGALGYPSVWCSDCARLVRGEYLGLTPVGLAACRQTYADQAVTNTETHPSAGGA